LYDEFKAKGFVVLAIDVREEKEIVQKYIKNKNLGFPVLLDADGKVASEYGIRGVPVHFIINREGVMIGQAMGARDWLSAESKNFIRLLVDNNYPAS
jgi:peroxiredoxin